MVKSSRVVHPGRFAALILPALLGACASMPGIQSMPDDAKACPKQKPDACTMEYDPVIGYTADGEDQGVFSNHCSACREEHIEYTVPKDKARR